MKDDACIFNERKRNAAISFAQCVYRCVKEKSTLSGNWTKYHRNRNAIDLHHSDSIIEIGLATWQKRRFRLNVHSDKQGSLVGYGVFCRQGTKNLEKAEGLREYLAEHVPGADGTTPVHWAWYRWYVDEPLCDFALPETWAEVEKIIGGEESKGDDAFRRACDDLVRLAAALDEWYTRHPSR